MHFVLQDVAFGLELQIELIFRLQFLDAVLEPIEADFVHPQGDDSLTPYSLQADVIHVHIKARLQVDPHFPLQLLLGLVPEVELLDLQNGELLLGGTLSLTPDLQTLFPGLFPLQLLVFPNLHHWLELAKLLKNRGFVPFQNHFQERQLQEFALLLAHQNDLRIQFQGTHCVNYLLLAVDDYKGIAPSIDFSLHRSQLLGVRRQVFCSPDHVA